MRPKSTSITSFYKLLLIVSLLFVELLIPAINALAISDAVNALTPEEQAWIQDHPVIRVLVGNSPPYHFWDNGPRGISIEILDLIAERAGLTLEYLSDGLSWAEAMENIYSHTKVDLLPTAQRNMERDDTLLFSKDYLKLHWAIFARKNEQNVFALENLFGKTIAIEGGLALQEQLANEFPQIRQKLVVSVPDALTAVSEGQADAYVGNFTVAQYVIAHAGFNNFQVAIPADLGHNSLAFAMRDDWPQLATILNKGLDAITPEERSTINRKYFTVKVAQSVDFTHLRYSLHILAIILIAILVWNTLLRRKVVNHTAALEKELDRRRTSEAQYRRLVDSFGSDFVLFTLDTKGILTYISLSARDMVGIAPKDALNHHYSEFFTNSPVSNQAIVYVEAGLRGEQLPPFEIELQHRDGWLIITEATARPIFNDREQVIALEGVLHNITGRKQVEYELQQHREQLEELVKRRTDQLRTLSSAVEQSYSTIVITDLDGNIEYVNPAFTRTTGYSAEEVLEEKASILNSGYHNEEFFQELWVTLSAGKVWQGEMCNKRKDGSLYWELANISPVRDKKEHITHYVAVKEDITARKNANLALEESRKQLDLTLKAANLGSWDWRPQSGEFYTNDIFLTMLDYPADIDFPQTLERWTALLHQDDLAQIMELLQPFLDGNNDYYRAEYRLRSAQGKWKWILDVGRVIARDSKGEALRFIGVHIDITEQKQIENLLIEAQQQAESANKHKSQFLANMSHEIRTPMNALIGLSELALETELTKQQYDYLSQIHTSSTSLLNIINDILDLSTIEAGSIILKKEAFLLPQTVREIEGLFFYQARQKELDLQFLIDANIPKIIHGDASRLRQVLINLVGNALKFTSRGAVTSSVTLLSQTEKHVHLKFTVLDSGIGIPADKLSKLFKPFSQVDASYTRQYGGTGLGLAISKNFIEMMGGKLTVQSKEGHGSEFSFTLHFDKIDKKDLSKLHTSHDKQDAENYRNMRAAKSGRILLVEDNDINQLVATEILAKGDFQVEAVNNGEEAVAAYKSSLRKNTPFAAILMDIQMPILDGYHATTQIREWEASHTDSPVHIPIIAMTAHAMSGDYKKSIATGMDDFISKPVNRSELFKTLSKFITMKVTKNPSPNKLKGSIATEQFPEKSVLPKNLPGINLEKGIARLEGNSELYQRLLKDFIDQFHKNSFEFKKLLEQNNLDSAKQIIHTVKGIASNLCTYKLYDASIQLETAILENNCGEKILTQYALAWQELIESIESMEKDITSPSSEDIPKLPDNKEIVSSLHSNLLTQLDTMDFQAITSWQEIKPYLQGHNDPIRITEIDHCMAILDFKNAGLLIKDIAQESS
jgi:PAS domain S-box-containing protein